MITPAGFVGPRALGRLVARVVASLAFIGMAGLALSCSRPTDAAQAVRIGYFANLTHAQAVLGVASGDYARAVAPATLETKISNEGPSLIEALFAGEID